ncbi:MAG: hypothetical protein ACTSRA_07585 [Promethearchaeota archaeon]
MVVELEETIIIDKSRTYAVNAGKCNYCGYYRTWEFKVLNPKTGKLIPGHVTEEGFKINDGSCPYWSNLKKQFGNRKNNPPTASSNFSKNFVGSPNKFNSKKEFKDIFFQKNNNKIVMTIVGSSPITFELEYDDVLKMIHDAIKQLIS